MDWIIVSWVKKKKKIVFVDAIDLCGVGLVDLVAELVARSF